MAIGAEAINSVFYGLIYGSLIIIGAAVAFAVYYAVTFKHKVVLFNVNERGVVGRAKIYKCRERKNRAGGVLWSGRFGKIPQPAPEFTRVCGRGSLGMAYFHEGTAVWIKPQAKELNNPDFIHNQLDLFTGNQKSSYLAIEEQAAKKRLGAMDRLMQFVNVGVLVLVLLVIVFGWSELSSTPKELAGLVKN